MPWPRSQSIDLGLDGNVPLPLYWTKTGHIALYLKRSLAAVPKHPHDLGEGVGFALKRIWDCDVFSMENKVIANSPPPYNKGTAHRTF